MLLLQTDPKAASVGQISSLFSLKESHCLQIMPSDLSATCNASSPSGFCFTGLGGGADSESSVSSAVTDSSVTHRSTSMKGDEGMIPCSLCSLFSEWVFAWVSLGPGVGQCFEISTLIFLGEYNFVLT